MESFNFDQGSNNNDHNDKDNDNENEFDKPKDDIDIKVKKRKTMIKLDAVKLVEDPNGIDLLNTMMKEQMKIGDNEFKNLHRMMTIYKKWHAKFLPAYKFDYFVERLKKQEKEPVVLRKMEQLRNQHKNGGVLSEDIGLIDKENSENKLSLENMNIEDAKYEYQEVYADENDSPVLESLIRHDLEDQANNEKENKSQNEQEMQDKSLNELVKEVKSRNWQEKELANHNESNDDLEGLEDIISEDD